MTIIQSISRSILLIIGITISITILAQIPSNVPQNGLLAYYAFNGNTNDLSGNNNHLTNNNATLTSDRSGNTNTAYAFNGTNSYLEGPKTLGNLTTTTELSVSFWAKGNAGAFISKYWNLDFTRSSFSVGNNRISGDGTNYLDYVGSNSSDWKHYLVTYKAGSNNSKIYINGTLVTQGTLNLNSSSSTLTPFTIGSVWSSPENYLNGSFDELAVFDRVLTATEIAALASIVITPSVSLSLDKTTISEKSGKASLLATLNKVVAKDTLINLTTSGSAINDLDYKFSYPSKGIPSLLATTNGRNYSTQDYPTSLAIGKNLETYLVDRAVSTIYMLKTEIQH